MSDLMQRAEFVRELAEAIMENPIYVSFSNSGFVSFDKADPAAQEKYPWCGIFFQHKGKRYHIEMVVTKVEDL